jgi:hypothetical protein
VVVDEVEAAVASVVVVPPQPTTASIDDTPTRPTAPIRRTFTLHFGTLHFGILELQRSATTHVNSNNAVRHLPQPNGCSGTICGMETQPCP